MATLASTTDHRLGFASQTEEVRAQAVPVSGELPAWLTGGLVRVTPAQMDVAGKTVDHWFDGLAMLHRFGFDGTGGVSYASRFLDTHARRAALAGKPMTGFGTADPCRKLFQRVQSVFSPEITDNANVNLVRLGDEHIAMTETPIPIVFDPETLETVARDDVPEGWGPLTTAHPHHDAERGELLNFAAHLGRRNEYRLYARRSRADGRTVATHSVKEPAYMHSFAITERYTVLLENPFRVNPMRLLLSGKPFIENYRWNPEDGLRLLVFDRTEGRLVHTAIADPCFVFHTINAFEDGRDLVVDVCAYEDTSIIGALGLGNLRQEHPAPAPGAEPRRIRFSLDGGPVRSERLADTDLELPRINYRRSNGKPYRYIYGGSVGDAPFLKRLVKVDLEERTTMVWDEPAAWAGEPVFVARPGAEDEDDGVVLSVVLDADAGRSSLLVLDAQTFDEVARADAPHVVPFGFHGQFFRS